MKTYIVRLSADAIVSANVLVQAKNADEARRKAILIDESEMDWDVGLLHETLSESHVLSVVERERQ